MGEIVQEIVSLDPMFAENNSELYFALQRWHLVELIKINEYHKALQLAKNDLASLSLRHPELVNPFKEIALMLIYPPQLLATDSVSNNSGKSKIKAITDAWTRVRPNVVLLIYSQFENRLLRKHWLDLFQ
jgi:hypothetical protein